MGSAPVSGARKKQALAWRWHGADWNERFLCDRMNGSLGTDRGEGGTLDALALHRIRMPG